MGELEEVVRQMFEGIDKGDPPIVIGSFANEAEGVDEISRRWMRGVEEVGSHITRSMAMVSDVHSDLREVHERAWGDCGVLTGWLEQDYTLEGDRKHISAPTTVVLRRDDGSWRIELFHSLPLPEET